MKFIHNIFENIKPTFTGEGKLAKYYPVYEAMETLFFVPDHTAPKKGAHIRDANDMKRMMNTVVMALLPCLLFGMWNAGHQHFLATANPEAADFISKFMIGAKLLLPIVVVSYVAGLAVEYVFAIVRKHAVNEGFLVSGMLIPLIVPVNIPLWMVAVATVFAVVLGKEVFGGTGFNILNPALTARAFLFFAYPTEMSGDICWVFTDGMATVEGWSGATVLAYGAGSLATGANVVETLNAINTIDFSPMSMIIGTIPGSAGETSKVAILIGFLVLWVTGVGSWRIVLSVFAGGFAMGSLLNLIGANPFMDMPAYYHLIIGGFAFGAVFMATDPVSASQTNTGKYIYGFLIGLMAVLIRVFNPAYPEGMMMAILLMNVFAPLIDYYVVQANKKRRLNRATV